MTPALRIEALHKSFPLPRSLRAVLRAPLRRESRVALDGCTLTIARGEKVALIGPNGAGKTTLARVVCGTALRDSGVALLDELDVAELAAHAHVALARPDDPALHPRLTAIEALRFHARLYGLATVTLERALAPSLEALDAHDLLRRRVATLSAGEKAKISLCKALLGQPSLLILDELSRVLDPKMAERVRALLDARCAQVGLAVLLITHDLDEARRCHRVLVMAQGRVIATGNWSEVRAAAHALFGLTDTD
ncbi:MAG: ABC transporter ATP-binding protein [Myxococcales bacterium]|jgi:ABC-type multidrug transport system ATPase subunit|nr:ABC transporter ATP-binding protein [Myxococcales bacterium]